MFSSSTPLLYFLLLCWIYKIIFTVIKCIVGVIFPFYHYLFSVILFEIVVQHVNFITIFVTYLKYELDIVMIILRCRHCYLINITFNLILKLLTFFFLEPSLTFKGLLFLILSTLSTSFILLCLSSLGQREIL